MTALVRFAQRYAPFLASAVVLVAVLAVAPSRPAGQARSFADGFSDPSLAGPAGGAGTATAAGGGETSDTGGTGASGGGGAGAVGSRSGATVPGGPATVGADCTRRTWVPEPLPCKPAWAGASNGGATWKGVTDAKITIVWFEAKRTEQVEATRAAAGTSESNAEIDRNAATLERFINRHVQLYGRAVDVVVVYASASDVNDEAGWRAEAVRMDEELHAFAVIGKGALIEPMQDELARRGIIAYGGPQNTGAFYERRAPYLWNLSTDADVVNRAVAEYAVKRLVGRNAVHAGDPRYQTSPRRFGVIYNELFAQVGKDLIAELRAAGVPVAATASFAPDLSTAQQHATNAAIQMRDAGVTTVTFVGGGLALPFFTQAADQQAWQPEWFVNSFFVQDVEEVGRLASQTQWAHAFGLASVPLREPYEEGTGFAAYRSIDPSTKPSNGINTMYAGLLALGLGIEGAGPQLDPGGFQRAMFALPAYGGTPTLPRLSYGGNGPGPYSAIDDFAEIWWDADRTCFDDQLGCYVRVDGGRRYSAGGWPKSPPKVFDS